MSKIAVLGDRDSVLGFRALGLEVIFAEDRDAAVHHLHRLAREEYAIIYITEDLACTMMADIGMYHDKPTPAVILIPGRGGSLGVAQTALKQAVERAVGADIT